MYTACVGPTIIRSGDSLPALIHALVEGWLCRGEDAVIWHVTPGASCRVAATLRGTPAGRPEIIRHCHAPQTAAPGSEKGPLNLKKR